jgi:hypothetical protein
MARATMSLDRYVSRSMKSVHGFLSSLDAQVIEALLLHQREANIAGHLCEIGVHHGRLFLMLALARQRGERALAIDLFEDDPMNANTEHAGRDGALFKNAQRLRIELSNEEIFKTSSLDLKPADIVARTTGPIRFFSIDGGHFYRHVENDLRLAQQTLSTEGIIAVDDFFNIGWADVSFATYDFLRNTDSVVPFAVTPTKIYLAPSAAAEKYKACLRGRPDIAHFSPVQILTRDVLTLRQGTLRRGYEFLRAAVARRAS